MKTIVQRNVKEIVFITKDKRVRIMRYRNDWTNIKNDDPFFALPKKPTVPAKTTIQNDTKEKDYMVVWDIDKHEYRRVIIKSIIGARSIPDNKRQPALINTIDTDMYWYKTVKKSNFSVVRKGKTAYYILMMLAYSGCTFEEINTHIKEIYDIKGIELETVGKYVRNVKRLLKNFITNKLVTVEKGVYYITSLGNTFLKYNVSERG